MPLNPSCAPGRSLCAGAQPKPGAALCGPGGVGGRILRHRDPLGGATLFGDGSYPGLGVSAQDILGSQPTNGTGTSAGTCDISYALVPGTLVTKLWCEVWSANATNYYLGIAKRNVATNQFTLLYTTTAQTFGSTGWKSVALGTPFLVPSDPSVTYHVTVYSDAGGAGYFTGLSTGHGSNLLTVGQQYTGAPYSHPTLASGYTGFDSRGCIVQGGVALQPDANGVITVTGAATVTPDSLTQACVVRAKNLVLDGASASLKPATNCRGLYLHLAGDLTLVNGATLNIDGLGKGGAVTTDSGEADVLPDSLRLGLALAKLAAYRVKQPGGAGGTAGPASGAGYNLGAVGGTGAAGSALQTGGGGGGGSGKYDTSLGAGAGGPGTAFCGGGGGGGAPRHSTGGTAGKSAGTDGSGGDGGDQTAGNGGPGGGGAGDAAGLSGWTAGSVRGVSPGTGPGGGILFLFVKGNVTINSGCRISADGMAGGQAYTVYNGAGPGGGGGGGAGGGVVSLFWRGGYNNSGTVRANGGLGGLGGNEAGNYAGGPGGAGSVATQQL